MQNENGKELSLSDKINLLSILTLGEALLLSTFLRWSGSKGWFWHFPDSNIGKFHFINSRRVYNKMLKKLRDLRLISEEISGNMSKIIVHGNVIDIIYREAVSNPQPYKGKGRGLKKGSGLSNPGQEATKNSKPKVLSNPDLGLSNPDLGLSNPDLGLSNPKNDGYIYDHACVRRNQKKSEEGQKGPTPPVGGSATNPPGLSNPTPPPPSRSKKPTSKSRVVFAKLKPSKKIMVKKAEDEEARMVVALRKQMALDGKIGASELPVEKIPSNENIRDLLWRIDDELNLGRRTHSISDHAARGTASKLIRDIGMTKLFDIIAYAKNDHMDPYMPKVKNVFDLDAKLADLSYAFKNRVAKEMERRSKIPQEIRDSAARTAAESDERLRLDMEKIKNLKLKKI